jgi:hypothetical protein
MSPSTRSQSFSDTGSRKSSTAFRTSGDSRSTAARFIAMNQLAPPSPTSQQYLATS